MSDSLLRSLLTILPFTLYSHLSISLGYPVTSAGSLLAYFSSLLIILPSVSHRINSLTPNPQHTCHHARHSNSSSVVRGRRLCVVHDGAVCWQLGEIHAQSRLTNSTLSNHDVCMSRKDWANIILAGYLVRCPKPQTFR